MYRLYTAIRLVYNYYLCTITDYTDKIDITEIPESVFDIVYSLKESETEYIEGYSVLYGYVLHSGIFWAILKSNAILPIDDKIEDCINAFKIVCDKYKEATIKEEVDKMEGMISEYHDIVYKALGIPKKYFYNNEDEEENK